MNIKKIAVAFVLFGLVAIAAFSYYIYSIMLVSNTAFNSKEAYVYIPTGASYDEVRNDLEPLLISIDKFDVLAQQKKYMSLGPGGRLRKLKKIIESLFGEHQSLPHCIKK